MKIAGFESVQPLRKIMSDYGLMSIDRHDRHQVATLIYESSPVLFSLLYGHQAIPILADFVPRSHNRFSHRYIRVATLDRQVVGMVSLIPSANVKEADDDAVVLNFWQRGRVQLAQRLLLDRLLQHDYPPQTMYISNLAVLPEYRGQGYGTQLLQHCIAAAKAANATTIFINVDLNNPRAKKLYESLGFQVIQTKTLRLFNRIVGSYALALPL